MTKRLILILLAMILILSGAVSAGAETVWSDPGALETDETAFTLAISLAGWRIPRGYHLEGYLRGDINSNERIDTAAVLRRDDDSGRALVVLLSGAYGYTILTYATALPTPDATNALHGIDIARDLLSIYTKDEDAEPCATTYSFALTDGGFSLASAQAIRWEAGEGDRPATRETFDYAEGWYLRQEGTISGNLFTASGDETSASFLPDTYGPPLDTFNIATFPTDWDGFEVFMSE